jgi:hypothetical protein
MAQDLKFRFDIKLPAQPKVQDDPILQGHLGIVYNSIKLLANQVEIMHKRKAAFGATMQVGTIVYFYDAGAGLQAALPAGYGTAECHAIVTTAANIGTVGEVLLFGLFDLYTSLPAIGTKLWASATPGGITSVNPGAGSQRIGYVLSATEIWFDPMLL